MPNTLHLVARWIWPVACPVCASPQQWCDACRPSRDPLIIAQAGFPLAAADRYDGPLGAAIRAWKLGGRHDLSEPLAEHLAAAVGAILGPRARAVLVPVPVRPDSRRRRGADLIADLGRLVARDLGLAMSPALDWRRRVAEQVGAHPAQRRDNLAGALRPTSRVTGAAIVIDDVRTTGATLDAAVAAVRAAGAQPVAAAVLAIAGQARSGAHRGATGG